MDERYKEGLFEYVAYFGPQLCLGVEKCRYATTCLQLTYIHPMLVGDRILAYTRGGMILEPLKVKTKLSH